MRPVTRPSQAVPAAAPPLRPPLDLRTAAKRLAERALREGWTPQRTPGSHRFDFVRADKTLVQLSLEPEVYDLVAAALREGASR